jgi:integrase
MARATATLPTLPRYLQWWKGGTIRVRVPVPAPLKAAVGAGELTRALRTGSIREAERLARPIIEEFEHRIDAARPKELRRISSRAYDWKWGPRDTGTLVDAPIPVPTPPLAQITFSAMVDRWADETEAPDRGKRDVEKMFARLAARLGHDDAARVTPDDIIHHEEELRKEGLSHQTIGNHLRAFKTVFRVAKEKRKITVNPMTEIRIRQSEGQERLNFDADERAHVLRLAWVSTNPVIKWMNLIAGFSGMRREEIAEAHTADIKRVGDHVVFFVREDNRDGLTLKTDESTRKVVMHSAIAEALMQHVESLPPGPLFRELNPDLDGKRADAAGSIVSRWLRNVAGITDKRKVFHSWRHTIATLMCDHGVPERRAFYITGHAPSTKGAKYVHHSIPEIAKAIETIPNPLQ